MKTLFGAVDVANPRWNSCSCQRSGPKTFRPATAWLRGTTSPELLYLETKWASLIPFAKAADLLEEVLPARLADAPRTSVAREHLVAVAAEAGLRAPPGEVAGATEPGGVREQGELSDHVGFQYNTCDKRHYHR